MSNHIVILGFGVIGTEALYHLLRKKLKKKLLISIVEKDFSNIPGGVAYSKIKSKYGFFNNPLRLSNSDFIKWIKKKNDKKKIFDFATNQSSFDLSNWVKNNLNKDLKIKDLNEIYLPRFFYSIFLKEKILDSLRLSKKNKNVILKFYKGEINQIKDKEYIYCYAKKKLVLNDVKIKEKNFIFKDIKQKKFGFLKSRNLIIGNGILPPKNIYMDKSFYNKNYIHDFYTMGGTEYLLKKIKNLSKRLKNIKLIFIGNKAGLLEPMQQLEKTLPKLSSKIKLISISSNKLTLEKAELSNNYKEYRFRSFTNTNILKIKKSSDILNMLKKEFKFSKIKKFSKYDVWTLILKKKILNKCFTRLSIKEKVNYNNITFSKIRNLTRYTYPETVRSKDRMIKKKLLYFCKDKVDKLLVNKNFIEVVTKKNKRFKADIVVNVSGPSPLDKADFEIPFIESLRKIVKNFNNRGFYSNKHFEVIKKIYIPGTLSSNFNPNRKTIIRSITENTLKSVNHFLKVNKIV